MEITKFQRGLMEHTIGEPNRNWFATSFNCKDSIEFEKLVDAGYATKQNAASWMGDDVIYHLTPDGKKALAKALIDTLDKLAEKESDASTRVFQVVFSAGD